MGSAGDTDPVITQRLGSVHKKGQVTKKLKLRIWKFCLLCPQTFAREIFVWSDISVNSELYCQLV